MTLSKKSPVIQKTVLRNDPLSHYATINPTPNIPEQSQVLNTQNRHPQTELTKHDSESVETAIKSICDSFVKSSDPLWGDVLIGKPELSYQVKPRTRTLSARKKVPANENRTEKAQDNPQVGYGDITYSSMQKICNKLIEIFPPQPHDIYCDLGSGFGACVPQISMLTKKRVIGIEIVHQRVNFALATIEKFKAKYWYNEPVLRILNNCQYFIQDIDLMKSLVVPFTSQCITHLYAYNYVMSDKTRQSIVNLINRSPWVKVLVWNTNERNTLNKLGLHGFEFADQLTGAMRGSGGRNDHQEFYIFKRTSIDNPVTSKSVSKVRVPQNEQSLQIEEEQKQSQALNDQKMNSAYIDSKQTLSQNKSGTKRQSQPKECQLQESLNKRIRIDSNSDSFFETKSRDSTLWDYDLAIKNMERQLSNENKENEVIEKMIQVFPQGNQFLNIEIDKLESSLQEIEPVREILGEEWAIHKFPLMAVDQKIKIFDIAKEILFAKRKGQWLKNESRSILEKIYFEIAQNVADLKMKLHIESSRPKLDPIRQQEMVQCIDSLLQRTLSGYRLEKFELLNFGATSHVFKCRDMLTQEQRSKQNPRVYAIKIFKSRYYKYFESEIQAMEILNRGDPISQLFIVKLVKSINVTGSQKAILMDLYPQTLYNLMNIALNSEQIRMLAYCILRGISSAHSKNITHRDLKPQNIMLTDKWIPKIGDWGQTNEQMTGTDGYQPPEYFQKGQQKMLDYKLVDSWSIGITLYRLANKGQYPIDKERLKYLIKQGQPFHLPDHIRNANGGILRVINKLLQFEVSRRFSPSCVMNDSYFNGLDIVISRPSFNIKNSN